MTSIADIMSLDQIKQNFIAASDALEQFMTDETYSRIESAGKLLVTAFRSGNKVISCGNGGSMCDAMHFAEELSGRFRDDRKALPALAISDASYITCTANDYGYEYVFARYLEAFGVEGDVLLAISTSGNSENIIKAVEVAQKKGMKVIGLTGKDGGKIAANCDIEIRAPHSVYADRAQEIHIKVIHSLIHFVEIEIF